MQEKLEKASWVCIGLIEQNEGKKFMKSNSNVKCRCNFMICFPKLFFIIGYLDGYMKTFGQIVDVLKYIGIRIHKFFGLITRKSAEGF